MTSTNLLIFFPVTILCYRFINLMNEQVHSNSGEIYCSEKWFKNQFTKFMRLILYFFFSWYTCFVEFSFMSSHCSWDNKSFGFSKYRQNTYSWTGLHAEWVYSNFVMYMSCRNESLLKSLLFSLFHNRSYTSQVWCFQTIYRYYMYPSYF